MNILHSDALVFFGATGDLAYKKIFPSLQAMVKRENLNVPVIGVAKAGTPVFEYEPKAWGPKEMERLTPLGGWSNPR
jgi:glucose-6-phosphate 1-dehydrogenase